jgi:DNA topoisomerase-6 subunit A
LIDKEARKKETLSKLLGIPTQWYAQMTRGDLPSITMPTRTKKNIAYDEDTEVWKYGDRERLREAGSEKSALHILKMAYVIWFIRHQIKESRSSTLRELYYISEGWNKAKFSAQNDSNLLIEDLEILTDVQREQFNLRPEEDGASLFGPLKIREETRKGYKDIHCGDDVGEAGYQIPTNVEKLELLEHDARVVIAIETGGMFARLIENGFDEKYQAILVHLKGQPARSTRRLLNRLSKEFQLPVAVFTDGDPWSYRIYASVAYGSIKSAHISDILATPSARFIGVQPTDIRDYDLPSDKLTEQDIAALKSELTDPRFASDYWREQINLQLSLNLKSEQQAFAARGLDFVTDKYLPARLSDMGIL